MHMAHGIVIYVHNMLHRTGNALFGMWCASYIVCDIAKSSPFCIREGEGGWTGRSLQTRLRIFQVVWILLRDSACEGEKREGEEKMESYSLQYSKEVQSNGLQTSRILNFMIRQNCTPISYFCSAGLAVSSDSLERFHPTGALRVASHP